MEERLILSVSSHPEIYDTSSYFYRDRNKKDLAWKSVGEEIGQPEDVCRKKWKSLRDTYLKEKRKEMEKRSGSAAGSVKKWKYSQILGFLEPFVTPRETTSNMGGVEAQVIEYNHPRDQGEGEAKAGDTETEPTDNEETDPRSPAASPVSPVPGPSPPAAAPTGQQRRRGTRRPRDGPSEVEQTLLELLRRPPAPPPPQSADEHFLLSLLPFLQSMPPHTKEIIKFKMYKLAMENSTVVLNLEQSDPHSPQ
ncbi:uncharacterized protein LOC107751434 [Sinocyclocheilus rhinocerous]|uniref:Uncharacterized LOC107751434 n=1 Tax=Sinocyclocheilus rhinocerous TaxID=307959 RepID=A0A673JXC2_9TELE|nr:PREDICTED: uncharacterized protein LOC107708717 [Sinocyclocheilus rhinocerous]XP_016369057.1 PREDICTED: uncharacterized protein LOC107709154 [Sinocyclocheilus rhinocerous]XP_016422649.1 PREDICTED: uncharacterized protein LOC107751434 [Sinocyclocheilus rhinocerous]